MSKLVITTTVDGVEVQDGSVDAVMHYKDEIYAAYERLNTNARTMLALAPDEVSEEWRAQHNRVEKELFKLMGRVSLFARDFANHGLEVAVDEAHFRKELKP
jgi:hypothetical protein